MRLITAGNAKFSNFIAKSVEKARLLGYQYQVYDLGGLWFGKNMFIEDESFHKHGHYLILETWKTKALHKPTIILNAI
jgi:hypothetical protein